MKIISKIRRILLKTGTGLRLARKIDLVLATLKSDFPFSQAKESELTFFEVTEEWRRRCLSGLKVTTQARYENMLKLYFEFLNPIPIQQITPKIVDAWLDQMKNPQNWTMRSKKRQYFKYELSLVATILKYYEEYHEDPHFKFPIKQRHRIAAMRGRSCAEIQKDLSEEELEKFVSSMKDCSCGEILSVMAIVQYYQALRVSEVSALHWEDITIDPVTPEKSRLRVSKSLKWCRRAGAKPALENGFKNSGSSKLKEQPMFPKTHEALMSIFCGNSKGPIFLNNGNFFTYRQLQYAYETAFASAGLTQRGTHVMRHGGCRNIFNKVPDVTVAQQLLGNSSLQTTMVYAKRRASALTEVANAEWEDHMARGKEIAMCRK